MKIQCQSCQAKYTIADEKVLGKVVKIRCKKCSATIVINGNEHQQSDDGADTHVFDSFECAIHALAPTCAHCGCRIIGHGMESEGVFYCCAHCAHEHGIVILEDRAREEAR